MKALSLHRRPPVWLALLAMLWQLLLPWSQVMAHDTAAGDRVPVCTATGLKWISLDEGTPAEPGAKSDGTHCALCYFEQHAPALHDTREPFAHIASVARAQAAPIATWAAGTDPGIPPPIRAPPFRS